MDHATSIATAATAKDAAAVGAATKQLMGTCATCHGKYRDKAADGTYMIKKM
jgi:cytochrome c556